MPIAFLTLASLHTALGYSVAWALDLPTLLRIGLPIGFMALNVILAPYILERAYRIDWNPEEPPLDEDVLKFVIEILQMHASGPPVEIAMLVGAQKALGSRIPVGLVREAAPAIMVVRSPTGGPGLVVSTGFRETLGIDAQKAAVAHEMHYLLGTERPISNALLALPTMLLTAYRMVGPDPGGGFLARNAASLLYGAYRVATALSAWQFRSRVYAADAFAVEMTGDPNAMADAIMGLNFGIARAAAAGVGAEAGSASWSPLNLADGERAAALGAEARGLGDFSPEGMVEALRWEDHNLASRFFELFSFHPLPSRRLHALDESAGRLGREFVYPLDREPGRFKVLGLVLEVLTRAAPWVLAYAGWIYCTEYDWPPNLPLYAVGGFTLGVAFASACWYLPWSRFHPVTTREALRDTRITESLPKAITVTGKMAGRQKPGYAFGSDLMIEDGKGMLTVQYRQPIPLLDTLFAYLAADKLNGRPARVDGWLRRNPSPYIEARRIVMQDDGSAYGCYRWLLSWLGLAACVLVWMLLYRLTYP